MSVRNHIYRHSVHRNINICAVIYIKTANEKLLSFSATSVLTDENEQVAEAFRAQLTNEEFGEKGGAGLGMLQIAKRTGGRIEATIEPFGTDEYFCTSQVAAQIR